MCLLTIPGWRTEGRSGRGRDGIRIQGFGMADRTCRSAWDSESDSMADMDGAGIVGDSTGTTPPGFITTTGTTRGATRFTTATLSIEGAGAEDLTAAAEDTAGAGGGLRATEGGRPPTLA